MHVSGAEHIPREGAAIVAPNHKSFWDSFFIGVCTRRHLRFMAKTELIEARYGRLLVRLGAFPVRRGQADADALETARVILEQGGLLALFPEGTRDPRPGRARAPASAAPAGWRSRPARRSCPARSRAPRRLFLRRLPGPAPGAGGVRRADPGIGPGRDAGGGLRTDRGHAVARGRGRVPTPSGAADADRRRPGRARDRRRASGPEPAQAEAPARARSLTAAVKALVRVFRHFPAYIADN